MARTKMESYVGPCVANQNILPLLWENIKNITGKELSKPLKIRHFTIFDDNDGNEYVIGGFTFRVKNNSLSSPLNDKLDFLDIDSIIPKQNSSEIEVYYLR